MTELFNKTNFTENTTEYDLDQFIYTKTRKRTRKTSKPPAFSIVNNSNKRIEICSKEILEPLNYPKEVQIAYFNNLLLLTNSFNQEAPKYKVQTVGKSSIIHSKPLVLELINYFNLDRFVQTILTFGVEKIARKNNQICIFINMKNPNESL